MVRVLGLQAPAEPIPFKPLRTELSQGFKTPSVTLTPIAMPG